MLLLSSSSLAMALAFRSYIIHRIHTNYYYQFTVFYAMLLKCIIHFNFGLLATQAFQSFFVHFVCCYANASFVLWLCSLLIIKWVYCLLLHFMQHKKRKWINSNCISNKLCAGLHKFLFVYSFFFWYLFYLVENWNLLSESKFNDGLSSSSLMNPFLQFVYYVTFFLSVFFRNESIWYFVFGVERSLSFCARGIHLKWFS